MVENMDSYTKKELIDEIRKSAAADDSFDLESVKYDDKRLKDPLFCKKAAAALEKSIYLIATFFSKKTKLCSVSCAVE
jgi:hypothetical protein